MSAAIPSCTHAADGTPAGKHFLKNTQGAEPIGEKEDTNKRAGAAEGKTKKPW